VPGTRKGDQTIRRTRFITLTAVALALSVSATSAVSAAPSVARKAKDAPAIFVDPAGSDRNPCTAAAPCATFDRAYHVAQAGQVVQVAGGSYPAQRITADASKAAATANVAFRPAPGASVVLANSALTIFGAHVEIHGISMDETACVPTTVAPPCPSVVIQPGAHDVVIDGVHASRFYITAAYNVTVENSDFGPAYDFHGIIHADTAGNRPHDILLLNDTIHDHWNSDACKATAACISAHHQGCGPTLNDAYNVVEEDMHWYNCQDLAQLIKSYKFANQNITVENSVFGQSSGFYSLMVDSSSALPGNGIHIRYNTFAKGIAVSGVQSPDSDIVGNIAPVAQQFCARMLAGGWKVEDNLILGSKPCGRGDRVATNAVFAADGYHISRLSPARAAGDPSLHPALDIDGDVRPIRTAPDAGADQHETALVVPGKSVGAAAIAMQRADIEAFYGPPARAHPVKGAPGFETDSYHIHGGLLDLTYQGDTVVGILTTSPYYSTRTGIGPGTVMTRGASWLRPLRWVKCRQLYQGMANGMRVEYSVIGKTKLRVTGIAMTRRPAKPC
jgi:hypothetical protein